MSSPAQPATLIGIQLGGEPVIEEISLKNLRSFANQTFRIAPLTIFIGQNSAGKSSITRLIPLLKQSMEQISSAPILWNSIYVDYGSIHEVLRRGANPPVLQFSFALSEIDFSMIVGSASRVPTTHRTYKIQYSIDVGEASKGRTKPILSTITIDDDVIQITYDPRRRVAGAMFNGRSFSDIFSKCSVEGIQRSFVPTISVANFPTSYVSTEVAQFSRIISESLDESDRERISPRLLQIIARHVSYAPRRAFHDQINDVILSWSGDTMGFSGFSPSTEDRIRPLFLLRDISRITRYIFDQLYADIMPSQYIGPIRSRAERYYRIQELAIDHIDPGGENLAMYLNYLTPSQLRRFNEIFSESFGFIVEPYVSRGHVSLMIKPQTGQPGDNIADVGFGFSQVLPVIAQAFAATEQRYTPRTALFSRIRNTSPVVAVEQPELHLHPAYQAKLADLFVSLSKRRYAENQAFRFVIETHSEAFINRLGRLVATGRISSKDVLLYTFEKSPGETDTTVRTLSFDQDGLIANWPVGFFTAK